jgi:glycosyltransferase involved in cell wall biosynthesis
MQILFIHQVFLTPNEAGSTRHFELAKYLVKVGHQVTIIGSSVNYLTGAIDSRCQGKFIFKETIDGVEIIKAWTYSRIHKNFFSRFVSFVSFMVSSIIASLNVKKVDLVIGCSPQIFAGVSALIVGYLKRIPFVFEIRDLWPKFAVEMKILTNKKLIWLAESLEKYLYRHADYFIINSPGFKAHLARFNLPEEKIFLIPNGVDTDMFQPGEKNNSFRKEHKLENKFIAMYAGAHGQANNLQTVIEAASLLKDNQEIIFLLVGDGKEKNNLIELKDKYGLINVLFIEAQPKEKMPEICRATDVCLAILENREAFKTVYPNKVFDYMSAARPTILAIDGVIREVIEQAEAGIYVPPENPQVLAQTVLKLYNDREIMEKYGQNARKYVMDNFERERIAEKLNQTLVRILNQTA